MRITLNQRSEQQLLDVMKKMNITNPTHCVQTLITSLYQSYQSQPIEDNNGPSEKEGLSNLQ